MFDIVRIKVSVIWIDFVVVVGTWYEKKCSLELKKKYFLSLCIFSALWGIMYAKKFSFYFNRKFFFTKLP